MCRLKVTMLILIHYSTNIKNIEKAEIESKLYTDYEDQFQWFIGVGLLFLILFFVFPEKQSKLLRQLVNEDN